jgi:CHAT domain-containing protein
MHRTLFAVAIALTLSAGSLAAAPAAYEEPLDAQTLNTIKTEFGKLMELANRHDFEALPVSDSSLMLEHFTISYTPSASFALALKRNPRKILWPWQPGLKAFADPLPGSGEPTLAPDRAWPRLPQAVNEVDGIARILGGKAQILTGLQARKEFLATASAAPVLHFATHAFADLDEPARSYILLAPATPAKQYDYLFLKEVYDLPDV